MNEYSTEKFIEQYEHIKNLQLLSDEELNCLKRKRTRFEVLIKCANVVEPFIEYIKYELILLKRFEQANFEQENDAKSLERAISYNIKKIYQEALKKFRSDRTLWKNYMEFIKAKYPNTISSTYQMMLAYHHTEDDFIEVVRYEIERHEYYVANNIVLTGRNRIKNSPKLISLHIECLLQHAENEGDKIFKDRLLKQATEIYTKYIKGSEDISIFIDLLQNIQNIKFCRDFQDEIILHLLAVFPGRPEFYNLLAKRALDGLIFNEKEDRSPENIPFHWRLRYALTFYDKALEIVEDQYKKQIYEVYLTKLEELETNKNLEYSSILLIGYALGKTLISAYNDNCLSEKFFLKYLVLRLEHKEKYEIEIKEIICKGLKLYPNSMTFYEITIKYYASIKNYNGISELFSKAIALNESNVVDLYEILCKVYQNDSNTKERLKDTMMEAAQSSNKSLAVAFQPYILEYYASTSGIKEARGIFFKFLNSRHAASITLDFLITMINLEKKEINPDKQRICFCFERAVTLFGSNNPDIWINYIKYSWKSGKYNDNLRSRAVESLKGNLKNMEHFELNYSQLLSHSENNDED